MKTKCLTAIVTCTILISLSGCAADKPTSMLHSSEDSTVSTETLSVTTEEIQTVAQSTGKAEEMPVQSAATETPQISAVELVQPGELEAPKQTEPPRQSDPMEAPQQEPSNHPAEAEPPKETEQPKPTEPPSPVVTEPPVEVQSKTAYDIKFDISVIRADCIAIGQSMGYALNTSLTPQNAAWWNPVTASESNQGSALRSALEDYIWFHTVSNLSVYGLDEITEFNICCESRDGGAYSIYFVFA